MHIHSEHSVDSSGIDQLNNCYQDLAMVSSKLSSVVSISDYDEKIKAAAKRVIVLVDQARAVLRGAEK